MLARQTPGFSGADIANVCNEAALIAARNNSAWVNKQCFLDAVDRIIGGLEKKTKVMTADEKRAIALHEAGHATISWFCQYANPLVKVTIVPRGQALGAAWYMPEERQITTKEEILDDICATLGGRAAEDLCIGRISTGAMNDLEKVTKRSYGMIAYAGMSESLPNLCYYNNEEYSFTKPYSDYTAKLIDEEVKKLIAEQYARAKQILMEHKEGHAELAQLLIDKEVIYAEDVERIFGKRPWVSRTEEILAANAEVTPPTGNDDTDHSAENEEFIRKKVVEAVVEKAKKGEMVDMKPNGTNDKPQKEKREPKQFHELKVTTHETPAVGEGLVAQAVQTDMEDTASEKQLDDADAMEPFELLNPIETTEQTATEQTEDIHYIAPKQPEETSKQAEKEAPETPSQSTDHPVDSKEQTLFGW